MTATTRWHDDHDCDDADNNNDNDVKTTVMAMAQQSHQRWCNNCVSDGATTASAMV
jgi:hypothetical protein